MKATLATLIASSLLLRVSLAAGDTACRVCVAPPEIVDSNARYVFYLHGAAIEVQGLNASHPDFGRYQYDEITHALADQGFVVISEARLTRVDPTAYAQRIAHQVNELLDKGVAADHITVIGHSKGGKMALLVATMVKKPQVNFVIMAGCLGNGSEAQADWEQFLTQRAPSLHGRILSLYDQSDKVAGTCRDAFAKAGTGLLESNEIVTNTGRGHGLFYAPDSLWINEVVSWARRKSGTTDEHKGGSVGSVR